MYCHTLAASIASLCLLPAIALAQEQPRPAFEVAAVRPVASPTLAEQLAGARLNVARIGRERVDFENITLLALIMRAYGLRSFRVSGPEWIKSLRFDLTAILPKGTSSSRVPEMLQSLLADRFHLTVHWAQKEFAIFALEVSKDGLRLERPPIDDDPAADRITRPMTLDAYAERLTPAMDAPVVDMTGLAGPYLISLVDLQRVMMRQRVASLRAQSATAAGEPRPDLETDAGEIVAIVRKLGLNLERRKLSMPLLVIDRLEKTPTEN